MKENITTPIIESTTEPIIESTTEPIIESTTEQTNLEKISTLKEIRHELHVNCWKHVPMVVGSGAFIGAAIALGVGTPWVTIADPAVRVMMTAATGVLAVAGFVKSCAISKDSDALKQEQQELTAEIADFDVQPEEPAKTR